MIYGTGCVAATAIKAAHIIIDGGLTGPKFRNIAAKMTP